MSSADNVTDLLEHRRRRALYRAQHRGTKEMDWLIGRYAERHLADMNVEALAHFEEFIARPDPELQRWIMDGAEAPAKEFAELVARLRVFHGLAG